MKWAGRRVREHQAPTGYRRSMWVWLFPTLSLVLIALAWQSARVSSARQIEKRLDVRTNAIQSVIEQRLSDHEHILRGILALFETHESVTREDWAHYLHAIHPESSTIGLQAIGFSARIPAADRDRFEAAVQAERLPFTVWPGAAREELHAILYVYPMAGNNLRALGYDMSTDPVRNAAMVQARDHGTAALSRPVQLIQQDRGNAVPGFFIYLPVYRRDMPTRTVAERRAALRGFVYGAFRTQEVIASAIGKPRWGLDFEFYDGLRPTAEGLLFRSAAHRQLSIDATSGAASTRVVPLEIGGHRWLLIAAPSTGFLSTADGYQH